MSLTLKNKSYLYASMVPWRTFKINGTFQLHKRIFIEEFIYIYIYIYIYKYLNLNFYECRRTIFGSSKKLSMPINNLNLKSVNPDSSFFNSKRVFGMMQADSKYVFKVTMEVATDLFFLDIHLRVLVYQKTKNVGWTRFYASVSQPCFRRHTSSTHFEYLPYLTHPF